MMALFLSFIMLMPTTAYAQTVYKVVGTSMTTESSTSIFDGDLMELLGDEEYFENDVVIAKEKVTGKLVLKRYTGTKLISDNPMGKSYELDEVEILGRTRKLTDAENVEYLNYVFASLIKQNQSNPTITFDKPPTHGSDASVSWGIIDTATNGYQVEVYKNQLRIINISTSDISTDNTRYTITSTNFTAGDSLYVRVRANATNTHNASSWVSSATVKVQRANQAALTSITFNTPFINISQTLSWARVDTAQNGYSIEKSTDGGINWENYISKVEQPLIGNPSILLPSSLFSMPESTIGFRVRVNPTTTHNAGPYTTSENRTVALSGQSIPAAPTLASRTSTTIMLNRISDGIEYSMDEVTWKDSTEFTGLSPGTEYTLFARRKATQTQTASASSKSKLSTDKGSQTAPPEPTAETEQSITTNSITLKDLESGVEYRMGFGPWTQNRTFSNLQPGTSYTFYARRAGTDTHYPSLPSPVANITTKSLNPEDFTEPLAINHVVRLGDDLYTVVKSDNNGPMLLSNTVLDERIFDNLTNNWAGSSLRQYLNQKYINTFNGLEINAIREVSHPRVPGETDKIRLLEESDALNLLKNTRAKAKDYWLMTPYVSQDDSLEINSNQSQERKGSGQENGLKYVNSNGNIGEISHTKSLGLVPVLNLKNNLTFKGAGTIANPFVIFEDGKVEQTRPPKPVLGFVREGYDRTLKWIELSTATEGYDVEVVITKYQGGIERIFDSTTSNSNTYTINQSNYSLRDKVKYRIRAKETNSNNYSPWSEFSDEVTVLRIAQRTNELEVGEMVERNGEFKKVASKTQDRGIVLEDGSFLELGVNLTFKLNLQGNYYELIERQEIIITPINQQERAESVSRQVLVDDQNFNAKEQNRALLQYIVNNDRSLYSPPSGVDMTSKVFLLGMDELNQYVIDPVLTGQSGWTEEAYLKKPSKEAMDELDDPEREQKISPRALKTIQDANYWRYWLRTPKGDTSNQVLTVTEDRKVGYYDSTMSFGGVVPAMYIDLNLVGFSTQTVNKNGKDFFIITKN
jgi:hypothetical protein